MYWREYNGNETKGYVDLTHTGDLDEYMCLASYVFTPLGGAISWKASLLVTLHYLQLRQNTWH